MSDVLRMITPYVSPDALRAFLHTKKNLYNLYPNKYLGFTDIDGLQYVGTSENFGSEMLFETRKLRMNKPSIEAVLPSEYLSYYFDLIESDFINTYRQQNAVMACVKQNTLLPNHTYKICFTNVELAYILRAKAYSNPDVEYSKFYQTYDNPVLIIDDTEEIELFVQMKDNSDHHATWFIQVDKVLSDLYQYNQENARIEADLKDFVDIAAFMVCLKGMQMLPPINWYSRGAGITDANVDFYGHPLFEYGTDGNDVTHVYPCVYGPVTLRGVIPDPNLSWLMRVHGDFFDTDPNNNRNMTASIHKVDLIGSAPGHTTNMYEMHFDETYVRMSLMETLKHDDGTPRNTIGWTFRKPQEGDSDYDGTTYNNPIVAEINMDVFAGNETIFPNEHGTYIPCFAVSFKDEYFRGYESEINAMDAGIHIDFTTDFSDHSIHKKYGIVHDLCEFDGLPKFYGYNLERTVHHAHMELYAIRDHENKRNQHAMDKQTAGIIIESGVPITDYIAITDDMKPVIVYAGDGSFRYKMIEENIVSDRNFLSNIIGIDGNHFMDIHSPNYESKYNKIPKFIYHGNRHFSVGMIEFDPDLQYGRVFAVTNDPAGYQNNETSKHKKAERTLARICDIPTSFVQLQNIPNVSPTLIIDKKYVRQQASFDHIAFDKLWNDPMSYKPYNIGHYQPSPTPGNPSLGNTSQARKVWIPTLSLLKTAGLYSDVITKHGLVVYPQQTISMATLRENDCFHIFAHGRMFSVGDIFGFNIGGIFLRCEVTATDSNGWGELNNFRFIQNTGMPDQYVDNINEIEFPISNFEQTFSGSYNGYVSLYDVTRIYSKIPITKDTVQTKAMIAVLIKKSLLDFDDWNARVRTIPSDPPYSFIYRPNDNAGVCAIDYKYTYDAENQITGGYWDEDSIVQLTGDLDVGDTVYDTPFTYAIRDLSSVFMYNILTNQNYEEDSILVHTNGKKSISLIKHTENFVIDNTSLNSITIEDLFQGVDLSMNISNFGMNVWNCFIMVLPKIDRTGYSVVGWMYDMNASYLTPSGNHNLLFPAINGEHVETYDNSWSSIKFNVNYDTNDMIPLMYDIMHTTYDEYRTTDVSRLTARTKIQLSSLLPTDIEDFPEDVDYPYDANIASFNVYRFSQFDYIKTLKNAYLNYGMRSTEDMYQEIIDHFGNKCYVARTFNYVEQEYVTDHEYLKGEIIVQHDMSLVKYMPDTTYATDTYLIDYTTRKIYRVVEGYTSTTLEYDLSHGYIVYIGMKTTVNTDTTYLALKQFRAKTIEEDLADGKIELIGLSEKRNAVINYLMENTFRADELKPSMNLKLFIQKNHELQFPEEEPAGGFVPLIDLLHENVTINSGSRVYTVDPMYIFKIDQNIIPQLATYRVMKNDIDISEQSMLIIKNGPSSYKKYVFHDNQWTLYH